jgi:hypothetical protein
LERANKVAAIESATKALAAFDAKYAAILGGGWQQRLAESTLSEGDEMAAAYVTGSSFDYPWNTANAAVSQTLAAHLVAKATLDANDLKLAALIGPKVVAELAPKMTELLALSDPKTIEYYRIKYSRLLGIDNNESVWQKSITPAEWLTLASGEYDAALYTLIRENLLVLTTSAMVANRKAANEDTEGPAFEAAMAPVVAALGAPLFDGLQEAAKGLGLDLTAPDYVPTVTRANRLAASVERRTVSEQDAKKAMGTVMFVKGVTGYNAWTATLTKP